jgi:hypothetical protein
VDGLAAPDLVTAWETGSTARRLEQPLAALSAWMPQRSRDHFSRLPMGDRDKLLLELHIATFGPLLKAIAHCPSCSETVEFTLDAGLLARPEPGDPRTERFEVQGYVIDFRLPDTLDLIKASAAADAEQARSVLVECCVLDANGPDGPLTDGLPDSVIGAFAAELARLQPASDIEVGLTCPGCSSTWVAHLDLGSFVWEEIASEARRLVYEVDRLARSYGWREADILAMTPARRRTYLAMVE